jgi:hypothetical protein
MSGTYIPCTESGTQIHVRAVSGGECCNSPSHEGGRRSSKGKGSVTMTLKTVEELYFQNLPKVRFRPDNDVRYWMDFTSWEGLPSDRDFFIVGFISHGDLELVARGYGARDDYGNGSVHIKPKELVQQAKP